MERQEIDVSVSNGKVFLSGIVDYRYEKRTAAKAAATVKGVAEVQNNLVVRSTRIEKSDWIIRENIKSELWWSPYVDSDDV